MPILTLARKSPFGKWLLSKIFISLFLIGKKKSQNPRDIVPLIYPESFRHI